MLTKFRLLAMAGVASLAAYATPRVMAADGMGIGDYDTATLTDVLYAPAQNPALPGFWLQFFPNEITFDSEEIRFDAEDLNEFRLAPFVAPNVQGRVLRSQGSTVKSFRPAYTKSKHTIDPSRTIPRRAGEGYGGTLSRQERYDAIVADNLRRERKVTENRWDWMACRAIVDAAVTVVDEDYPARTVEFGRDPRLTGVLAGAAQWSEATANPLTDLHTFRRLSFDLAQSPITSLIFGLDAWDAFTQSNHPDVQRLLDGLRKGNQANFNSAGLSDGSPFEYQGQISGFNGGSKLDLYTYSNRYKASDGTFVPYLDTGVVVGVGKIIEGTRCFGAIMDIEAQMHAVPMFPKAWNEQDPSRSYTMTQSAPLMVPGRPNNTFKLKVVG